MTDARTRLQERITRLLRRRRFQRGFEWMIAGLVLQGLLALILSFLAVLGILELPVPTLPQAALSIALLLILFCTAGLLPLRRDLLLYDIDRRLGLGAALITANSLLQSDKALNAFEEAQLQVTVERLSTLSPGLLLPWRPPASLLVLPFLALLVPMLWLLPDTSAGESEARMEARELARRLAARGEETEDPRFSDLARLLNEFIRVPDEGGEKRAGEGEKLELERPRGLERIPSVEEGAAEAFDYDEALEELFRLAPGRSEEGYSLSRSLAESLGLDEEELERLDEHIAELDERTEREASEGGAPGDSPGSGNEEGFPGSGGGEEGAGSPQSPDGQEGSLESENGPGGGSGAGEADSDVNENGRRESGPAAGGSLEELGGRRNSEEQLRGALRYLSPEGRALVEQGGIGAEYSRERESAVGGRQLEGPAADYVGDYFELLNRKERE